MSQHVIAFVGIGSNLDDPLAQVRSAVGALRGFPDSRLERLSSWYRSPPMGPTDQPDYINGVAAMKTALDVLDFFSRMQEIERQQGRVRGRRWGPRTLDLDLLTYGDLELSTPRLTLPHPGLSERAFVLVPLAEIATDAEVAGFGSVTGMLDALPSDDLHSLERLSV